MDDIILMIILPQNLHTQRANKICKFMQLLSECPHIPKTLTPAISTPEALGDHVDFALLQTLLPLF